MAGCQIAIPLIGEHPDLTSMVVLGLAVAAVAAAISAWGLRRGLAAALATAALALAVEAAGVHTGWPFGRYRYLGVLRPTLAGVPVIVPLAWVGMGFAAWDVAGRLVPPVAGRVVAGAVALTGWDLFLDPQMTKAHYWVWTGGGIYRGIPLSNFAGWLACSVGVMAILALTLPRPSRSLALLGIYSEMAIMETVGFLVFFGDPVVGVVGGAATLPLVALAWTRRAPRATVSAMITVT